MRSSLTWSRLALALALAAPVALNGCSFISIGVGVAAALGGGGGGGGSDGPPPATGPGGPPWHLLASMGTARSYHSLSLLPDGTSLVAGGLSSAGSVLSSCELYDHERNAWFTTGTLATARSHHTATQLDNGWIAVVGGFNGSMSWLQDIELYDPLTGTWSTAATPGGAHAQHTATALANYELLVTGTNGNAAAERYDWTIDTWSPTGSMVSYRSEAAAVLLGDGRVLVCGGDNASSTTLSSAELYDPSTDTWTAAASMSTARRRHSATLLRDGRVLIVGGHGPLPGGTPLNSAEIYSPASNTWSTVGSTRAPRDGHTATLLPDNTLLVVGGLGAAPGASFEGRTFAERFLPASDTWQDYGGLVIPRFEGHRAVMLTTGTLLLTGGTDIYPSASPTTRAESEAPLGPGGNWQDRVSLATPRTNHRAVQVGGANQVLVTGGWNGSTMQSSCELISPNSGVNGTRTGTGAMSTARNSHTLIQLSTGKIIAAGGWTGTAVTASSEEYLPGTGTWTASMTNLSTARSDHCAVLLKNNFILIAGGDNGTSPIAGAELYDPAMMSWMGTGSMNNARKFFTLTRLTNGRALAVGGWDGTNILQTCDLYDPTTGSWSTATSMPATARDRHAASTMPDGRVFVSGGWNGVGAFASCLIYNPGTGGWTTAASMPTARRDHVSIQTLDGRILVYGGIDGAGNPVAAPELYDAQTNTWMAVTASPNTPAARVGQSMTVDEFGILAIGGDPNSGTTALASIQRELDSRNNHPNRPVISQVDFIAAQPVALTYGNLVTISGSNLRGGREGSTGGTGSSPGDMPVVTLTGPIGGASGRTCSGDPQVWRFDGFYHSDGLSVDFQMPNSPFTGGNLGSGIYALRVISGGIPSQPFYVQLP